MKEECVKILTEELRRNYDAIAGDFSKTRNRPNGQVRFLFENFLKEGDKVLDLGCANGRYVNFFKEKKVKYTGLDSSLELVNIAKKNYPNEQFIVGDALNLPFPDGDFDKVFSLAVLHHIPSLGERKKFFNQARRVLKPGGLLAVTVWDLRPVKMLASKKGRRFLGYAASQFKKAIGMSPLDFGDFFIPWRNDRRRYVHAFILKELRVLACGSGLKTVKSGVLGNLTAREGNLYIVAEK
jgi:ubiquinone/menaquinone biosynthesis C-methylase UbiE